MAQLQIFEGTPDQLAKQLGSLSRVQKYRMIVSADEPDTNGEAQKAISFGMFPQLRSLAEEDFEGGSWRGEDMEL